MERMRKGDAALLERIVVVGAGVVGLGIAERLARAGATTTVVDPCAPGSRASRAAGGMLSPLGEATAPGPFLDLAVRSLDAWPTFAARLEATARRSIGFDLGGKVLAALDEERETALRERARWLREEGFEGEWLDRRSLRELEPSLTPEVRGGLLLTHDGTVDNRALTAALAEAAERAGCELRIGPSVERVDSAGGAVAGVRLDDGEKLPATSVVVAAGAWSGRIEGVPRPLPVRPVRGQMIAYRTSEPLVGRVVSTGDVYLIPRAPDDPGRLVVGATQEEAGFDARTTPEGLAALRAAAEEALTTLAGVEPVERWAGLRPGTPDDLPVLGTDPELDGLVWATGHFRNGILLTPVTVELVARTLLEGGDVPSAFRPDRFG